MPGPPPKHRSQRRRQNVTVGPVKLSSSTKKTPPITDVGKETKTWWSTVWASPMASVWLDADVLVLRRLAALMDLFYSGEITAMLLAEIRQLEDRLGLSPLARRRLQWEIDQAGEPAAKADTPEDGERWLRAVSG